MQQTSQPCLFGESHWAILEKGRLLAILKVSSFEGKQMGSKGQWPSLGLAAQGTLCSTWCEMGLLSIPCSPPIGDPMCP